MFDPTVNMILKKKRGKKGKRQWNIAKSNRYEIYEVRINTEVKLLTYIIFLFY